jgi:hypothetical protein
MEKKRDLIGYISNGTVTNTWENGKAGQFDDLDGDCLYRFRETDQELKVYLIGEWSERDKLYALPVLACGFVGWLIKNWGKPPVSIFESYLTIRLNEYKKKHEKDADAWKRNLETEFYSTYDRASEERWVKQSEAIFEYITVEEQEQIKAYAQNYFEYVDSKMPATVTTATPQQITILDNILQALQQAGFIENAAARPLKWLKSKTLLAYFVEVANDKLKLKDSGGRRQIKPFETLFDVSGLQSCINDYKNKTGQLPQGSTDIDKIFSGLKL